MNTRRQFLSAVALLPVLAACGKSESLCPDFKPDTTTRLASFATSRYTAVSRLQRDALPDSHLRATALPLLVALDATPGMGDDALKALVAAQVDRDATAGVYATSNGVTLTRTDMLLALLADRAIDAASLTQACNADT